MPPSREMRVQILTFPNKLGAERIALDAVVLLAKKLGFSPERVDDIKLALAEACTNAIAHGCPPEAACEVTVTVKATPQKLDIVVEDAGISPPPEFVTAPDIHKMVSGEARLGGMGLYLIQRLMDEAEFLPAAAPHRGNRFHMVMYVPSGGTHGK